MTSEVTKKERSLAKEPARERKRRFVSRRELMLGTAVGMAAIATLRVISLEIDDYKESGCRDVDTTSVLSFQKKIEAVYDDTYKPKYTLQPEKELLVQDRGKMAEGMPQYREISEETRTSIQVTSQWLDKRFMEASGVTRINVANLNEDNTSPTVKAAGQFYETNPKVVYLDAQYFNGEYGGSKPTQTMIDRTLTHEIGHAIVTKYSEQKFFCEATSAPPDQFASVDNNPTAPESVRKPNQRTVTDYGMTSPTEDIAEIYEAIWGYWKQDVKDKQTPAEILEANLSKDNPIIEKKTAIALAMLDEVSAGLGEVAIAHMAYIHAHS